ncbi:MAG: hypothetical protein LUH07_00715 [Lachnospiraceae bacterium]|nr:hypothetical protein [Lachnospiraceae bacterium]
MMRKMIKRYWIIILLAAACVFGIWWSFTLSGTSYPDNAELVRVEKECEQ